MGLVVDAARIVARHSPNSLIAQTDASVHFDVIIVHAVVRIGDSEKRAHTQLHAARIGRSVSCGRRASEKSAKRHRKKMCLHLFPLLRVLDVSIIALVDIAILVSNKATYPSRRGYSYC